MSNSNNWVSHTPDTEPQPQDLPDPSPPSAFEKFFFPLGQDQQAFVQAARHLSETNTTSNRPLRTPEASSIHTQDFETAAEEISEHEDDFDDISIERDIYKDDILGIASPVPRILEETEDPSYPEYSHMGSRRSKKSKSAKTVKTMEPTKPDPKTTPTPPTEEPAHFYVLDRAYEGAKSAWAFGKGIVVFKPFMGVAEIVAEKALSVVGVESLDSVDNIVLPHLMGIDKDLIDPAILKIWSIIEPVVGKGEDIAKSVVAMAHKKPKIECEKTKECKEVSAPELSTPSVPAVM